jgi:hypothetical protein
LRDTVARGAVWCGLAIALVTETLSPLHLLRRGPLAAVWLAMIALALLRLGRVPPVIRIRRQLFPAAIAAAILGIAGVAGFTAILSPPNSADAMAYHLPRVVYWAQSGTVAFFPTRYLNQIMLAPLAEYFMLHGYVLSGGDHWVNLVAFGAFLGTIVVVSAIAQKMGLAAQGQAMAALFAATLPSAILQASGAKNDSLLTLWLACVVYFALRREWMFLGFATGLAMATKATAFLFAPPLIVAAIWIMGWRIPWARAAAWMAAGVLLVNLPQLTRNVRLSGSPLGYDSAHGDGEFRWRNEHPGWKSTVSNALRHTSEQLGARSPKWNQAVFDVVVRAHGWLGVDSQDPGTSWPGEQYRPPRNAKNHEADANSRWHLLWAAIAAILLVRNRAWRIYAAGLAVAFLVFCFYLKWQPYMTRLELPVIVLAAPLAGRLFDAPRRAWAAAAAALFLVNNARPALFENWTRPLRGPHSLFAISRDEAYFGDMSQWHNRESYMDSVEVMAKSGCALVGIDLSRNELEYPFQALLRERAPSVRFVLTGVTNSSARYYPDPRPSPCAVFCPDCADDAEISARYRSFGPPRQIGRFLLFLVAPEPRAGVSSFRDHQ